MNKQKALDRLLKAVNQEVINNGYGDLWENNWDPEASVKITLTIDEVRCASYLKSRKNAKDWWLNPLKPKSLI